MADFLDWIWQNWFWFALAEGIYVFLYLCRRDVIHNRHLSAGRLLNYAICGCLIGTFCWPVFLPMTVLAGLLMLPLAIATAMQNKPSG